MERLLITGADGMLGSYFKTGTRTDRATLDVTNLSSVMAACKEYRPRTIIHLASATDLAFCEKEPEEAYLINAVGTYHMALAARAVGAKLVYISTSGIFDGTKSEPYTTEDIPSPVNVYGHSKYLGELAVRSVLGDYLIVRTSWLFGGGKDKDKKFVGKILGKLSEPEIRAVADRRGSPTYANDLVLAVLAFIEEGRRGILHVGGADATRCEVAREIVSAAGSAARVLPADSAEFKTGYSSGQNESMVSSIVLRPWQEALREYLREEWDIR